MKTILLLAALVCLTTAWTNTPLYIVGGIAQRDLAMNGKFKNKLYKRIIEVLLVSNHLKYYYLYCLILGAPPIDINLLILLLRGIHKIGTDLIHLFS